MIKNFEKLNFLFNTSSFIMEPEPKLRNFFGSGSSQNGRLRNSGLHDKNNSEISQQTCVCCQCFILVDNCLSAVVAGLHDAHSLPLPALLLFADFLLQLWTSFARYQVPFCEADSGIWTGLALWYFFFIFFLHLYIYIYINIFFFK